MNVKSKTLEDKAIKSANINIILIIRLCTLT